MTSSNGLTHDGTASRPPAGLTAGRLIRRPATIVWLILVAATLTSSWLGEGHGARRVATVAVIIVALVKVFLVGQYFMELRRAPLALRLAFGGWVVVIGATLVGLYLHAG